MGAIDKARHTMDEAAGKAKEALGRASGNKRTEDKGKAEQATADLKQAGEKTKDAFKH
jgi:uncharacterized protein YjbJ (UPF0337 family)